MTRRFRAVNIGLDPESKRTLEDAAKERGLTLSGFIRLLAHALRSGKAIP